MWEQIGWRDLVSREDGSYISDSLTSPVFKKKQSGSKGDWRLQRRREVRPLLVSIQLVTADATAIGCL